MMLIQILHAQAGRWSFGALSTSQHASELAREHAAQASDTPEVHCPSVQSWTPGGRSERGTPTLRENSPEQTPDPEQAPLWSELE